MVIIADCPRHPFENETVRSMFEARKRVFVDLLRWDVPVIDGRYEIDQFDDEHAVYLIVLASDGTHAGSARLLRTTRPHILGSLFPDLCASPPPQGPGVLEITQACSQHPASRRPLRGRRQAVRTDCRRSQVRTAGKSPQRQGARR